MEGCHTKGLGSFAGWKMNRRVRKNYSRRSLQERGGATGLESQVHPGEAKAQSPIDSLDGTDNKVLRNTAISTHDATDSLSCTVMCDVAHYSLTCVCLLH